MKAETCCLPLLLALLAPLAVAEEPPEKIAPAFRNERHFQQGAEYLRGLPEGTTIEVSRGDGFTFSLLKEEGRLVTELPPAQLEDDGKVLVLPSGYAVSFRNENPPAVFMESPLGRWSRMAPALRRIIVKESDGNYWESNLDPLVLRFPCGTRLDVIELGKRWEVITLAGARYVMELPDTTWQELPSVPSPPLIPWDRTFYLAGDGDDWRLAAKEDHAVFAWNWIVRGLDVEQAVKDVSEGDRRLDLRVYFNKLEYVQRPVDTATCVLGRRLSLVGGDSITFRPPGQDPETGFILPGPLEPDYVPVASEPPTSVPMRTR